MLIYQELARRDRNLHSEKKCRWGEAGKGGLRDGGSGMAEFKITCCGIIYRAEFLTQF